MCFDLTALIKEVSTLRPAKKEGRKAFDVHLMDGSKDDETDKLRTMKVAIVTSEGDADAIRSDAQRYMDNKMPVTFLLLQGAKDENGDFSFSSGWKGFRLLEAANSTKADLLAENATTLLESSEYLVESR